MELKILQKLYFILAIGLASLFFDKSFFKFLSLLRHNTKIPFYISLISVLLNVIFSVVFFILTSVGFIIIPIATIYIILV